MRRFKLPLQKCAHGIIDRIPEAEEQVSPLPDAWYVLYKFQALNFGVKLSNEKEKPLKWMDRR
jgi:hypothetical protein